MRIAALTFIPKTSSAGKPLGFWKDETNTREFFVNLANQRGFDPSAVENWSTLTVQGIRATKVNLPSVSQLLTSGYSTVPAS